jgi:hypothetical protein
VQEATGESVEVAYVDQGYTGEQPAREAAEHGINLEVVKHQEAKGGFVLLARRWVIERGFLGGQGGFGGWSRTTSVYQKP